MLAGGSGSRLHPITLAVSKQLLPVYDKPMVYYPISTLMLAGIREILVISTPTDLPLFQRLLGDGSQLGLRFSYAHQAEPKGLADAFRIGAEFIGSESVTLVLGDNIFHGYSFAETLRREAARVQGCTLFGYTVQDPQRYGVASVDEHGTITGIEEKPVTPRSNLAVTGLYIFDNDVIRIARDLRPSARGELEITDVNMDYVRRGTARLVDLGRGFTWLDTGTYDAMVEATSLVQVLEHRQGIRIACLEEIALRQGFISSDACHALGAAMPNSGYGQYVMELAKALA